MKIIVCVKQVPDTTEVRLDPVTGTLLREGIPSIINPDDKAGLEAALRLKDRYEAHVTVLTMDAPGGPRPAGSPGHGGRRSHPPHRQGLRRRRHLGHILHPRLRPLRPGVRSHHHRAAGHRRRHRPGGPPIAEHLGIPNISYAEELRIEGNTVVVRRQYEDASTSSGRRCPALSPPFPS
jgi:electron transfer flavoprotein beta subunit